MDDFVISGLHESKNEWVARLIHLLTPHIMQGMKSIFDEAVKLCKQNNEMEKYLMTFQNFVSRIPKWNENIIETESKRIVEKSACKYLEELITCVHIIQLKLLSAIRVGQKQKKININIPKLNDFVHKIYILLARKVYKNVYLFEMHISPLKTQRNANTLERMIEDSISHAIRESIPLEQLLQAYMDETVEEEVVEEVKEEIINVEPLGNTTDSKNNKNAKNLAEASTSAIMNLQTSTATEHNDWAGNGGSGSSDLNLLEIPDLNAIDLSSTDSLSMDLSKSLMPPSSSANEKMRLSFNDKDYAQNIDKSIIEIDAPKSIDRLEEISHQRHMQSKADNDNDDSFKLKISNDIINLDSLNFKNLDFSGGGGGSSSNIDLLGEIEEL